MPVVCCWKESSVESQQSQGQLPQLPSLADVWQIPMGQSDADSASADASTVKRASGDAAWHPVLPSSTASCPDPARSSLLYCVGTRSTLALWDARSKALLAPVSSISGTGQRCDLVAHCHSGLPQLLANTRAGIRVLAPPAPHQPPSICPAQLKEACEAAGIQPMVRQDVVYAEPVDGTSLCEPSVAPDGSAVTALPVPGQAGHFTSGLFVFGRGAVGDMHLKPAPAVYRSKAGFTHAQWSSCRPALAALTRGGVLFWCEPHVPCTWPGPMYPAQFNLFPGNRDYQEGEQEWDRQDEEGRSLPLPDVAATVPAGQRSDLPPLDVLSGEDLVVDRGVSHDKPGCGAPLHQWSALGIRRALPPFLSGGGKGDSKFKQWATHAKHERLASSEALATAQASAVTAGLKRSRQNEHGHSVAAQPASSGGGRPAGRGGRFASLLTRVSVPGCVAKGKAAEHALKCQLAAEAGEAPPTPLAETSSADTSAASDSPPSSEAPAKRRIGIEEAVARLVHTLSLEQDLPEPVRVLTWEDVSHPNEDDGTWADAHPVAAAEQLHHHASRQLLGMALVFAKSCAARLKHDARAKRAALLGSSGEDAQATTDAAVDTLLKAGMLGQGAPLPSQEAAWEAEEASFSLAALLAAAEAARGPERYERAVAPSDMQEESEKRISKLRSAANGHRLRLLRYSQNHTEMNRAWGIAMQSMPLAVGGTGGAQGASGLAELGAQDSDDAQVSHGETEAALGAVDV